MHISKMTCLLYGILYTCSIITGLRLFWLRVYHGGQFNW